MKNYHYEQKRLSARQYHSNRRVGYFDRNGVYVELFYGDRKENALTWWDDFYFILGRRRVCVGWSHPRNEFHEMIVEQALNHANSLFPTRFTGMIYDGKTEFEKVGRSRKKVRSYTSIRRPEYTDYSKTLRDEQKRLEREANFVIKPSIQTERFKNYLSVDIVVPLEMRRMADFHCLAELVKRLLRGQTTLPKEFPDYFYDLSNWKAEECVTRLDEPSD